MSTSSPNVQEKPSILERILGTNTRFKEDWKHVCIGFSVIVVFVAGLNVVSTLVASIFSLSLESAAESSVTPEGLHTFFAFYMSTFPLTLSSTFIGLFSISLVRYTFSKSKNHWILKEILKDGNSWTCYILIIIFILLLSTWVGALIGVGGVNISDVGRIWGKLLIDLTKPARDVPGDLGLGEVMNLFLVKYGLQRFLLAIVTGGFTAWALAYKILPHIGFKRKANLNTANLTKTDLWYADLSGADLAGAIITQTQPQSAQSQKLHTTTSNSKKLFQNPHALLWGGYLLGTAGSLAALYGRTIVRIIGYICIALGIIMLLSSFILFIRLRSIKGMKEVADNIDNALVIFGFSGVLINYTFKFVVFVPLVVWPALKAIGRCLSKFWKLVMELLPLVPFVVLLLWPALKARLYDWVRRNLQWPQMDFATILIVLLVAILIGVLLVLTFAFPGTVA